MAEAKAAGVRALDFWHMTYREIYAEIAGDAVRRRRDRQTAMWAAWHGAAFERSKRLPDLGTLLAKMEPKREMSNSEIAASVVNTAKMLGLKITYRKRGEARA